MGDVLELAKELIRYPTPNPPGEERDLAEFLAVELRRRGLEAEVLPLGGAGARQANVLARLHGRGARAPLVFCGHLDTVPPGEGAWQRDPYTPSVEGDRLYGLGAADMKGGVAAMIAAATHLAAEQGAGRQLAGDLLLAFTSGEETASLGARSLAESGRLDGASGVVIGEPTANRVGIAEKGGIWMEVVLHGRTAHAALPHLGLNAVSGLVEVLSELEAAAGGATGGGEAVQALRRALEAPEDPLLGRPTLTPTRLHGGVASNVVPDEARAMIDLRTLPGQSHPAILEALEQLVRQGAVRRGLRASFVYHGERAPLAIPAHHPLAVACSAAVEATLGKPAERCGLTGATDASELVPHLNLPFVICGPGELGQAHHPDESVHLPALEAAVEIYVRLARLLLT
jgi:succinyl-diaminopimelate desuccinylase